MTEPLSIAVFASGRGSNFRAIHKRLATIDDPPARIALCISNNPDPGAFDYARGAGIATLRLSPKMFETIEEYDRALRGTLHEHRIGLIVLAGYMRKLPEGVVAEYKGRILNVHPALLPKFGGQGMYGERVHQAVLDAGETESGATVHLVDEEYDTGAIIAQERVPVEPGDTVATLAARVLEAEHRLLADTVVECARKLRAAGVMGVMG
jgi:phosphoribosylglycinamide formyltransferase-1